MARGRVPTPWHVAACTRHGTWQLAGRRGTWHVAACPRHGTWPRAHAVARGRVHTPWPHLTRPPAALTRPDKNGTLPPEKLKEVIRLFDGQPLKAAIIKVRLERMASARMHSPYGREELPHDIITRHLLMCA